MDKAIEDDIPAVQAIVKAAYSKYTERIGHPAAPMTADYYQLLKTAEIYVLRWKPDNGSEELKVSGALVVVAAADPACLQVDNVVVNPAAQGRGFGRVIMDFAELLARERGLSAITLYTNEKMYENLALYPKLGYMEVGRRNEDGFNRVFFRKDLPNSLQEDSIPR